MPNNFYYAASSYLDEWIQRDRGHHEKLRPENDDKRSANDGAKALGEFATQYGVIRTLPKTDEEPRLGAALNALEAVEQPTELNFVEKVDLLAVTLGKQYCPGRLPRSAASKFLWIRYKSPILIYDTVAANWLGQKGNRTYSDYCQSWRLAYRSHEDQVREACAELVSIKKFTLACDESDDTLIGWTQSEWFRERVFDHFMLNAGSWKLV